MSQSPNYREKRNAVAAWLRDRYGPDDDQEFVPDAAYWRDAADLIKFLRANGIEVRPIEEDNSDPIPAMSGL